jgi:hypothetical protein
VVGFQLPFKEQDFKLRYVWGAGRWTFLRLRGWELRMRHQEIVQVGHDDGGAGRLNLRNL